MKRIISLISICTIILLCIMQPVYAKDKGTVSITLPVFKVTINGVEYNNQYSKYPLIVYNDITYFPMTYYDCRFLGLETGWQNSETGLSINKTNVNGSYKPYEQNSKNLNNYSASIVTFPVKVNSNNIDNAKQKYPLLNFRDITYFPMTWNFCVNEFAWKYSFDSKNGLVINSDNSSVTSLGNLVNQAKAGKESINVAINSKYVYYQGENGQIFQSPLSNLKISKKVFQFPLEKTDYDFCAVSLKEENDHVYITYHQGEYNSNKDYCYELTDEGKAIATDKATYKQFDYEGISFKFKLNNPFDDKSLCSNNLYMKKTSDSQWKSIGDDSLVYGGKCAPADYYKYFNSTYDTDNFYFDGNKYIYIIASKLKDNKLEGNSIYRVDITNNETTKIVSDNIIVEDFCYDNGYLYYHNYFVEFLRYNLLTSKTELIPPYYERGTNIINSFRVLNNKIYATVNSSANTLDIIDDITNGLVHNIENDYMARVDSISLEGKNKEYVVCTFVENEFSNYRILIFNKNGDIVFKTAEKCYKDNITIIDNCLYFYNCTTKTICRYILK